MEKKKKKEFIPGSHCRAKIVAESWDGKFPHFLREALLLVLAESMHKNIHHGAHGCLQVIELEQEESRRDPLSCLCLES